MNENIYAYIIFLAVMIFIIVVVGKYLFTNGRVFLVALLNGNEPLANQINKLLLIAYYLFNIGYSCIRLRLWPKLTHPEMLFSSLASNIGTLVLILAATHYLNMLIIYQLSKRKSFSNTHKLFPS